MGRAIFTGFLLCVGKDINLLSVWTKFLEWDPGSLNTKAFGKGEIRRSVPLRGVVRARTGDVPSSFSTYLGDDLFGGLILLGGHLPGLQPIQALHTYTDTTQPTIDTSTAYHTASGYVQCYPLGQGMEMKSQTKAPRWVCRPGWNQEKATTPSLHTRSNWRGKQS
ncbi:uncharacterized protein BO87DRAFT_387296 [Aspergillus neoniger CBS 115656]|uniref:Uncharacterized protein n=1 Tax=Aspergillus neoniger (strain CBS 115656) TaxID=1448310 RepID=A0A318YP78_ASPNB|nr:hypothetical protein BO87DRAFT_387296 [Aspergillus neoniger CBS 115656]PYH33870.1 hypothetical protein BO87DRAFT_387296 [Aspergillus neoniger CBS 115656]